MDENQLADTSRHKARIILHNGSYLVWRPEDVVFLRHSCRIVGKPIGATPQAPQTARSSACPLLLCREEVALCLAQGFARLLRRVAEPPVESRIAAQTVTAAEQLEGQRALAAAEWMDGRLARVGDIAKGRMRKRKGADGLEGQLLNGDGTEVQGKRRRKLLRKLQHDAGATVPASVLAEVEAELRAATPPPFGVDDVIGQNFLESPWVSEAEELAEVALAAAETAEARHREAVFASLWGRGLFLAPGLKFGADFLAYTGDPLICHSSYMCLCTLKRELAPLRRAAALRVAHQVRKTLLLCLPDGEFVSVNWTYSKEKPK